MPERSLTQPFPNDGSFRINHIMFGDAYDRGFKFDIELEFGLALPRTACSPRSFQCQFDALTSWPFIRNRLLCESIVTILIFVSGLLVAKRSQSQLAIRKANPFLHEGCADDPFVAFTTHIAIFALKGGLRMRPKNPPCTELPNGSVCICQMSASQVSETSLRPSPMRILPDNSDTTRPVSEGQFPWFLRFRAVGCISPGARTVESSRS